MKTILLILCAWIGGTAVAYAQSDKLSDERRREFEAQKVAFFTRELDLSPEEAALFWPLYNEMQKKMRDAEGAVWQEYRKIHENENPKEPDYLKAINQLLESQQEKCDIKKAYYQKMLEHLPAAKIWKLDAAEHKFNRHLFDKLRKEPAFKPAPKK